MNILGIDLSLTGTGLSMVTSATIANLLISTPAKDSMVVRWQAIVRPIEIWAADADIVVIEGYSFGSAARARACMEIGGIVRYTLAVREKTVLEIPPTTLKKFVTGAGNVEKSQMLLQVYKRWGQEFKDDNLCDAFALAKLGQAFYTDDLSALPAFQRELIEGLRKKKGTS